MRTTMILDDDLIAKASALTGVEEKTRLVHMGLEALIHKASSRRLAALGGAAPEFTVAPRRKTEDMLKVAEPTKPYGSRRH